MAQRRMFSMRIVGQDNFLDMPLSTQALYFHLGMYSDDDGFVNPGKIIRMSGANADDLKILEAKKFVIPFKSGVIVVRHWKENNYIQKDRYQKTLYGEEMAQLSEDKDGVYILDTQDRIEIGKGSKHNEVLASSKKPKQENPGFEEWWLIWPKKVAKADAIKAWNKIEDFDEDTRLKIMSATPVQSRSDQWLKNNGSFIPYPATYLNGRRWEDEIVESHSITAEALKISL